MKKGKKIWITVLCVILALIMAVGVSAAVYVKHMLGKIQREDSSLEAIATQPLSTQATQSIPTQATVHTEPPAAQATEPQQTQATEPSETEATKPPQTESTQPPATETPAPPEILEQPEHILNFLLIGQDRRPNQGRQRSDVMILCTVDKNQNKLTLTSFQRDMYVPIPGYGYSRINMAYQLGGMALLRETLLRNFGVQLDGMVEVDFAGFTNIVDMLGGVTIDLSQAEADALSLSAGQQLLSGKDALRYARLRSIDSDFQRTNRQRTVIKALLKQNRNISLPRMHQLLSACLSMLITDMTDAQLLRYAAELFPLLRNLDIDSGAIPHSGEYKEAVIAGKEVLVPDMEKARQRLWDIISGNS